MSSGTSLRPKTGNSERKRVNWQEDKQSSKQYVDMDGTRDTSVAAVRGLCMCPSEKQTWRTKCRASCSRVWDGKLLLRDEPSGRRNWILAVALDTPRNTEEWRYWHTTHKLYNVSRWLYLNRNTVHTRTHMHEREKSTGDLSKVGKLLKLLHSLFFVLFSI